MIRPEVWQRWLDWDPVRMVPRYAEALRSQRASGSTPGPATTSTWTWARRRSATRCAEAGVGEDVIRFELFDAAHGGIDYRYPMSLAWLCPRIAG